MTRATRFLTLIAYVTVAPTLGEPGIALARVRRSGPEPPPPEEGWWWRWWRRRWRWWRWRRWWRRCGDRHRLRGGGLACRRRRDRCGAAAAVAEVKARRALWPEAIVVVSVVVHGPPLPVESSPLGEDDDSSTVTGSPAVYAEPLLVRSSTVSGAEGVPGGSVCSAVVNARTDGFHVANVRQAVVAAAPSSAPVHQVEPQAGSGVSLDRRLRLPGDEERVCLRLELPCRCPGEIPWRPGEAEAAVPRRARRVRLRGDVVLHQLHGDVGPAEGGVVPPRCVRERAVRGSEERARCAARCRCDVRERGLCCRYSFSESRRASRVMPARRRCGRRRRLLRRVAGITARSLQNAASSFESWNRRGREIAGRLTDLVDEDDAAVVGGSAAPSRTP